jgi:hypothetical protein
MHQFEWKAGQGGKHTPNIQHNELAEQFKRKTHNLCIEALHVVCGAASATPAASHHLSHHLLWALLHQLLHLQPRPTNKDT